MNDALHWNKIAPDYDKEIFNVFKSDKKKKLRKYVLKYADRDRMAIDFGCGVGKALPLLSPLFGEVLAVDVSEKCIERAKSVPHKNNVTFRVVDLAAQRIRLPQVHFAFCCNVAMSDDVKRNRRIIDNVLTSLAPGGAALFVLPSMESITTTAMSLINWHEREGTELGDIPQEDLRLYKTQDTGHVEQGIVSIDGVPTKHYLFTELFHMLNRGDYVMQRIDRLEYSWDTEFESPPRWMQSPYPWDWVIEVKRKR